MVYKGLLLIFGLLIVFGMISKAESHGSGPPFLLVNGKYAQSNLALTGSDPRFISGMDFSPDPKYLVNKPIEFKIDAEKIQLPEEQKKTMEYRWQWDKEDMKFGSGLEQSHTYTTTGSHYVTLEARPKDAAAFTVVDSVKLDVVKDLNYVLPIAKINVKRDITESENIISFSADITKDANSEIKSYTWKLDEGVYTNIASPTHRYPRGSYAKQVTLEVIDSQNFYTYTAYTFTDAPAVETTMSQESQRMMWPYYLLGVVICLPSIVLIASMIKRKSNG